MTVRSTLFFALLLSAACSKEAPSAGLPDVKLKTLSGKPGASLASCSGERCLTVYVAPWCGVCRGSTGTLIAFRDWLRRRGVEMRVVVGMDAEAAVRDYAREFKEALLDPDNSVGVRGGVPHFYVTDTAGRILKEVPGIPRTNDPAELAGYFGLLSGKGR